MLSPGTSSPKRAAAPGQGLGSGLGVPRGAVSSRGAVPWGCSPMVGGHHMLQIPASPECLGQAYTACRL